jgi:tetratricopeptide (TPR) repeat protein
VLTTARAAALGDTLLFLDRPVQYRGDEKQALQISTECLALCRGINDPWRIGRALHALGDGLMNDGDIARAHTLYSEALGIARNLGDPQALAAGLRVNAKTAAALGNPADDVLRQFEESIAISRSVDDQWGVANSYRLMGYSAGIDLPLPDYEESAGYFQKSVNIFGEIGDRIMIANTCLNWGRVAFTAGRLQEAEHLYRDCVLESGRLNVAHLYLWGLLCLANIDVRREAPERAMRRVAWTMQHIDDSTYRYIRAETTRLREALLRALPPAQVVEIDRQVADLSLPDLMRATGNG